MDGTMVPMWKEKSGLFMGLGYVLGTYGQLIRTPFSYNLESYALCAAVRTSDKLLAVVSDWDAFSASHGSDWCKAVSAPVHGIDVASRLTLFKSDLFLSKSEKDVRRLAGSGPCSTLRTGMTNSI